MNDWKTKELTKTYLEGVRGAIPLAKTQLELILRIVKSWNPGLGSFLDLGCGDGIIGRSLFEFWPNSEGVFLDFSEPMMKEARAKSSRFLTNSTFLI